MGLPMYHSKAQSISYAYAKWLGSIEWKYLVTLHFKEAFNPDMQLVLSLIHI